MTTFRCCKRQSYDIHIRPTAKVDLTYLDRINTIMSNLDNIFRDLVIANRILATEEVVDAYGHVSIRHPDNPNHFLIARSLAPDLVTADDIVELGLDGQPVGDEKRTLY